MTYPTFDIAPFLSRLSAGGVKFATDEKSLFDASLDHIRYSAIPQVVVFAENGDEIAKTLSTASEYGIPVTVRGAGTGCSGGCVPICGGAVLDLSRINFVEIDAASRTAHVGAGAVNADVDKAANKVGLFYAPDPSSHKYSTIGGNIACNAGGLRALKYGTTRENVLALSAYLASGEKIGCGLPVKKLSAGMNLRDLLIGSEGTLAVVSEAWLKLLPIPKSKTAALAFFIGDSLAFKGIERIMCASLSPSVLEFMDAETIDCVRRRNPKLSVPEGASALLVEFDEGAVENRRQAELFVAKLSDIAEARFADDVDDIENLWRVRRAASQAMYELGDSKISQDIVLPSKSVSAFFKFFKELGRRTGLPTPTFGHAGDGNYHIHFMYNSADARARERAVSSMDEAILATIRLGGAVSGEHGIGFLKSKYMPFQHSQTELNLMRSIKKVFDPKNILNRSKVYTAFDASSMKPLTGVKLPWD